MESSKQKVIAWALSILLFLGYFQFRELQKKNAFLTDQLDEYQSALSEANDNIDEANSQIEDAQSYAWSDYDDMGYALESLTTVDTVSDP